MHVQEFKMRISSLVSHDSCHDHHRNQESKEARMTVDLQTPVEPLLEVNAKDLDLLKHESSSDCSTSVETLENRQSVENEDEDTENNGSFHQVHSDDKVVMDGDITGDEDEQETLSDLDQSYYSTLGEHEHSSNVFVERTKIWITTVAAPPVQIFPIIRALYLIRWQLQCEKEVNSVCSSPGSKSVRSRRYISRKKPVTILIPWVEDSNDRARIYGNHLPSVSFDSGATGRKQQIEYIKKWAITETSMTEEVNWLKIRFYPAQYDMNTFVRHLRWVQEREAKDLVILRASSRMNYLPSCSGDASRLPVSLDVLHALTREDNVDSGDNVRIIHIDIEGNEVGYSLEHIFSPETDNAYKPKLRTISYDDEPDESNSEKGIRTGDTILNQLNNSELESENGNGKQAVGPGLGQKKNSTYLFLPVTKVHKEMIAISPKPKSRGYWIWTLLLNVIFILLRSLLTVLSIFLIWFILVDEQYLFQEKLPKYY